MAEDFNALNTGIYNKLNVSSITSLVSGVYHYKAPQGTDYPYVCYWVVSDIADDYFGEWKNNILLQIDIYSDSNSAKEVGDIAEEVSAVMDETSITVTGYSVYFCSRGNVRLLYQDEDNIFHLVMEYNIKIEKNK